MKDSVWNYGPVPNGTYGWGGIVTDKMFVDAPAGNFCYASFCGDHVETAGGHSVSNDEIVAWCNPIQEFPNVKQALVEANE